MFAKRSPVGNDGARIAWMLQLHLPGMTFARFLLGTVGAIAMAIAAGRPGAEHAILVTVAFAAVIAGEQLQRSLLFSTVSPAR